MRSTIIKPVLLPTLALAFALSASTDAPTTPDRTVVPSFETGGEPPHHPPPRGQRAARQVSGRTTSISG